MRPLFQLQAMQRTFTPSELDGMNELKQLFLAGLEHKPLVEVELELNEIEVQVEALGERLTEMRAELQILCARLVAVGEARKARLEAHRPRLSAVRS